MLKAAIVVASLAFASSAMAGEGDVGGTYDVYGKNPDGSQYTGTAVIDVTTENTCRITWKTGSSTSAGICMRNGTAFAAGYELSGKAGLVVYEIKEDGSMMGLWTIADQAGVGTELLTPQ
jgi:hypothetical protein